MSKLIDKYCRTKDEFGAFEFEGILLSLDETGFYMLLIKQLIGSGKDTFVPHTDHLPIPRHTPYYVREVTSAEKVLYG